MKITALEIENVKAVKAVRLEPTDKGLTLIGGRNGQGKTSVLDGIAYALGGESYRPSSLKREGSVTDPYIRIETDDGYIIERKGKNSDLKITDSTGRKSGQTLLNSVISKFAIDLPKFINATASQKAEILLKLIGVGEELKKLEMGEKAAYDSRHAVGVLKTQKQKAVDDSPYYEDAPESPVSVKELIAKQQDILARNGVKQRLLNERDAMLNRLGVIKSKMSLLQQEAEKLTASIKEADAEDTTLEDTAELEAQIADYEAVNQKVAANAERQRRQQEADELADQYDSLTKDIENYRQQRMDILAKADLPLPGLTVENGELKLNGKAWDCMSASQQLIVACSIASRLSPKCRFVLMDKLEQLDLETLEEFGKWLEEHDLQCIATRVSTGDECTVVIQDGEAIVDGKPIEFESHRITKAEAIDFDDWE